MSEHDVGAPVPQWLEQYVLEQIALEAGETAPTIVAALEAAYRSAGENEDWPDSTSTALHLRQAFDWLLNAIVPMVNEKQNFNLLVRDQINELKSRLNSNSLNEDDLVVFGELLQEKHKDKKGDRHRRIKTLLEFRFGGTSKQLEDLARTMNADYLLLNNGVHLQEWHSSRFEIWKKFKTHLEAVFQSAEERQLKLREIAARHKPNVALANEARQLILTQVDLRVFLGSLGGVNWLEVFEETEFFTAEDVERWAFRVLSERFPDEILAVAGFASGELKRLDLSSQIRGEAIRSLMNSDSVVLQFMEYMATLGDEPHEYLWMWVSGLDPFRDAEAIRVMAQKLIPRGLHRRNSREHRTIEGFAQTCTPKTFLEDFHLLADCVLRFNPDEIRGDFAFFQGLSVRDNDKEPYFFSLTSVEVVGVLDRITAQANSDEELRTAKAITETLPPQVRSRILAALALNPKASAETRSDILLAILVCGDSPNVDSLRFVEQALEDPSLFATLSSLKPPPPPAQITADDTSGSYWNVYQWSNILPISELTDWAEPLKVMGELRGALSAEAVHSMRGVEIKTAESPFSAPKLNDPTQPVLELAAMIAGWRPRSSDWPSSPRELGLALKDAIVEHPQRWLFDAKQLLSLLSHPTYIKAVISALHTNHTWQSVPHTYLADVFDWVIEHRISEVESIDNEPDLGYVASWEPVLDELIALIAAVSNDPDHPLDGLRDHFWPLVEQRARDWVQEPRIGRDVDPLHRAINRSSTEAFTTAFHLLGSEYRECGQVSESKLSLLTDALLVRGLDGEEYRAVFAKEHRFIEHIAPNWWNANVSELFTQSEDGLGQSATDSVVRWTYPTRSVFDQIKSNIWVSIDHDIDRATIVLAYAYLQGFPGYTLNSLVNKFSKLELVGGIGEALAGVLDSIKPLNRNLITRTVKIWRKTLESKLPSTDLLRGFGRLAAVEPFSNHQDLSPLLIQTLDKTRGIIDDAEEVCQVLLRAQPSKTVVNALKALVIVSNQSWDYFRVPSLIIEGFSWRSHSPKFQAEVAGLREALIARGHALPNE